MFIAITSGPRFGLVFLWFLLTNKPNQLTPKWTLFAGLLRTLFCGGWVYITSTDDHDWHDIFMIGYMILTIPWTAGVLMTTPSENRTAYKYRKRFATLFFGSIIPLIYFFIQHKVKHIAGGKMRCLSCL